MNRPVFSSNFASVALLAEGVDRNPDVRAPYGFPGLSPSSRRAWIEIELRKYQALVITSPSSRRAWIEIPG